MTNGKLVTYPTLGCVSCLWNAASTHADRH